MITFKQFILGQSNNVLNNGYRYGSEAFFEAILAEKPKINECVNPWDVETLSTDIGTFGIYEGQEVPLDLPLYEEDNVELGKPKRGGDKKFYVFVKNDKGNVIKVQFGQPGMSVKFDDEESRKSFAARHDCANKKDRTKPGYWSCNLPKYAKQLGLAGGGNFYW